MSQSLALSHLGVIRYLKKNKRHFVGVVAFSFPYIIFLIFVLVLSFSLQSLSGSCTIEYNVTYCDVVSSRSHT